MPCRNAVAARDRLCELRRRGRVIRRPPQGRLGDLPESPLPWLLGAARVFKQYDTGRRRQVLTDRLTASVAEQDLTGVDVAEQVVERDAAKELLAERPRTSCSPRRWASARSAG
ncbi:hypothetical protein NE236_17500 [Actinoallomurus purpureus]|uniref:hypothetical protein n=1 Tax=Actinoallomurus purpureus TaxID=478114 RepID=UPI002092FFEB|nr:hypothetical protein [Actinoallomurus purpureus]MCO6006784.1 hypothetical protein [Actinoallomurus purpureus]